MEWPVSSGVIPRSTSSSVQPTHILLFMHSTAEHSLMSKYTSPLSKLYATATVQTFTRSIPEYIFLSLSVYQHAHLRPNSVIQSFLASSPDDVHLMAFAFSLAGAYQLVAFARLYRDTHGVPLPARLIVFDCSPTSILRTPIMPVLHNSNFPDSSAPTILKSILDRLVAVISAIFLSLLSLIGRPEPSREIHNACVDPDLFDITTKRLYMYAAQDERIPAGEIEKAVAEAEAKGWVCRKERFAGVKHCGCVKQSGTYWEAVAGTWAAAVAVEKEEGGGQAAEERDEGGWDW